MGRSLTAYQTMLKDFRTRVGDIWELYEADPTGNKDQILTIIEHFANSLNEMTRRDHHQATWAEEKCPSCEERLGSHRCPSTVPGEVKIKIEKVGQIASIEIVGAADKVVSMIERALVK